VGQGPPRTSLFDDLCYYFHRYSKNPIFNDESASATTFATKIVALQWGILIHYHRDHFDHIERSFLDLRGLHQRSVHIQHEQHWNSLNFLNRRFKYQQDGLQSNILQLKSGQRGNTGLYKDAILDFEYLELECDRLQSKINSLVASASSISSITHANRAVSESRDILKLTLLGTTFLPLSFVSGLFSMQEEYKPGGPKFWIYCIVAIVLLAVALLLTFSGILHGQWKLRTKDGTWKFQL
jgi:hypothetical protein